MFQQPLEIFEVNITDCVIESWPWGVCGSRPTKKSKPRGDYEPRSAHGRAVKNSKARVDYDPRSAHGRVINNLKKWFFESREREISYNSLSQNSMFRLKKKIGLIAAARGAFTS